MLTREQILDDVREIVRAEAGIVDLRMVQPGSRLAHEMKTDALCLLNVYGALEQHFGVAFSMLEMTACGCRDGLTVGDLADAVAGKLQLPAAEAAA